MPALFRSLGVLDAAEENGHVTDAGLHAMLRDGVRLCELANKLAPGSVETIYTNTAFKFKCIENIKHFLRVCAAFSSHASIDVVGAFSWEGVLAIKHSAMCCMVVRGGLARST